MPDIVIGLGEVGKPLFKILCAAHPDTEGYDLKTGFVKNLAFDNRIGFMNICFPYSEKFIESVLEYQKLYNPGLTIIHSSVPIGTTSQIPNAVYSPILGQHDRMESDLKVYMKWIGGKRAMEAEVYLSLAGFSCKMVEKPEYAEALKLMCLAKYGVSLAFAHYQRQICDAHGIPWDYVWEWDLNYNLNVKEHLKRPIFFNLENHIGGHCVIPQTKILNNQHPNPMLTEVIRHEQEKPKYRAWQPCNIYPTAQIGNEASIGAFTEIGPNVKIGDRTRIGAHCFIPDGVEIENDVFIGPRVTFANDRYPPSGREWWERTIVRSGARIGASVNILPGVVIGKGAIIGMGSTITRDVPEGETWAGPKAVKIGNSQEHHENPKDCEVLSLRKGDDNEGL